jgi:hypothetical protein
LPPLEEQVVGTQQHAAPMREACPLPRELRESRGFRRQAHVVDSAEGQLMEHSTGERRHDLRDVAR